MAYVPKELKVKVNALLKDIIPKSWKWSLAVQHHSKLVLTIAKAPVDLVAINNNHRDLNTYWYKDNLKAQPAELLNLLTSIVNAMNVDNFDDSDAMSDYFNVGYYITVQFGKWDKPFQLIV